MLEYNSSFLLELSAQLAIEHVTMIRFLQTNPFLLPFYSHTPHVCTHITYKYIHKSYSPFPLYNNFFFTFPFSSLIYYFFVIFLELFFYIYCIILTKKCMKIYVYRIFLVSHFINLNCMLYDWDKYFLEMKVR